MAERDQHSEGLLKELEAYKRRVAELQLELALTLHNARANQTRLVNYEAAMTSAGKLHSALAQHRALLRAIIETAPLLFSLKTRDGLYQAASPAFCAFTGKTEKQLRGRSDHQVFPADLAAALSQNDHAVLLRGNEMKSTARVHVNGEETNLGISKTAVLSNDGEPIGVLSVITVDPVADSSTDAGGSVAQTGEGAELEHLVVLDRGKGLLYAAPWTREAFANGLAEDERIVWDTLELPDGCREPLSIQIEAVFQSGLGLHGDTREAPDPLGRWLVYDVRPIANGSYDLVAGVVVSFRLREPAIAPPAKRTALLDDGAPGMVELRDVARAAIERHRNRIPKGVDVSLAAHPELWKVSGSSAQLGSVIDNLIENALEATGGFGRVTVTLENAERPARFSAGSKSMPAGEYVVLSVSDTGSGIDPAMGDKVFRPFITTREGGRGMGLTSAKRIVEEHGGAISFESKPGSGTTFRVLLPCEVQTADANEPARPPR